MDKNEPLIYRKIWSYLSYYSENLSVVNSYYPKQYFWISKSGFMKIQYIKRNWKILRNWAKKKKKKKVKSSFYLDFFFH